MKKGDLPEKYVLFAIEHLPRGRNGNKIGNL